ncbi:hypothetical protein [Leptospira kmetyi]|uniref:Lipoprotein n=1 Tax=Leptospira kmetyi TaxID=408139 RepID=A0A2M9XP87_9LEPT|nr:hypothetical protein [Leptospira kmetyi]AYV56009.1 hypothetical protein EFP84_11140 [Leptospira kmetyi]PJZ31413.1 hypothetical protein CH378_02700 [Leptospira kmetyi]PJZ41107.1 hypothetical protein CH370_12745 [Leptospira kmetyi]TGK16173.1 hypothetical protein EHO62_10495 [Leptospira kmetyi]TGK32203.1 hypothetical protein EHO66_07475 [Leptospira kmetyi]
MKKRILAFLIASVFSFGFWNCNILVSNEQVCAKDIEEFDKCFPILLLAIPGCVDTSLNTCGFAVVEVAKEICRGRMKQDSCRAHR